MANYETYHADDAKPDIGELMKEYKAQAWSRGGAGKIKTSSLELVRSSRSLAGGIEEREGDKIPDEPEDLAEIERQSKHTARGRKGREKKKTQPKKKKARKTTPKKRKAKSKSIAMKGQDRGWRGRKEARANKETSPKRKRPRSESSSNSTGDSRRKRRKSKHRSQNVSSQRESKRRRSGGGRSQDHSQNRGI